MSSRRLLQHISSGRSPTNLHRHAFCTAPGGTNGVQAPCPCAEPFRPFVIVCFTPFFLWRFLMYVFMLLLASLFASAPSAKAASTCGAGCCDKGSCCCVCDCGCC